jgi:hypothetical protein
MLCTWCSSKSLARKSRRGAVAPSELPGLSSGPCSGPCSGPRASAPPPWPPTLRSPPRARAGARQKPMSAKGTCCPPSTLAEPAPATTAAANRTTAPQSSREAGQRLLFAAPAAGWLGLVLAAAVRATECEALIGSRSCNRVPSGMLCERTTKPSASQSCHWQFEGSPASFSRRSLSCPGVGDARLRTAVGVSDRTLRCDANCKR